MRNAEIADAFEELASLYELDGAVVYRVVAYRNAAKAIREAGVSVAEMAKQGRVDELSGVGKTIAEKIDALLETGSIPSADKLKARIPAGLIAITRIPGLGPKRARLLHDELGITSLDELREAAEHFCSLSAVDVVQTSGEAGAKVVTHTGLPVDLRIVPEEAFGNLLQHFTGSGRHNEALRTAAVRRGLHVSEYGIADDESGGSEAFTTEEEVYERLGMRYIPPELRENRGELDAAREGRLPKLLEQGDVRGDLHM